ncbi:unnamed protein product [Rhizoctonia solani]|uniref:Telomere length regulation protein conserved domain-containing protein n=1 Tax=Rhizoctonia solani TaxID=456999 RepID=A0A8H2Y3U5_9AGAM|nr:unnamed protein product [Rhizoctonia solani]
MLLQRQKLLTSPPKIQDVFPLFPQFTQPPGITVDQPKTHPLILKITTSQTFIHSVGTYLSHSDESILDGGMMGDMEGEVAQPIKEEHVIPGVDRSSPHESAQKGQNNVTPEPYSDDDSLIGYTSLSPTSSRAPSPTPSELGDSAFRRCTIPRPVYLAELGALLVEAPKNAVGAEPAEGLGLGLKTRRGMGITGGRAGGDAEDEKARVELALDMGAELVREKRGYGSELDENAINLACLFMGLQDPAFGP